VLTRRHLIHLLLVTKTKTASGRKTVSSVVLRRRMQKQEGRS